MPLGVWVSEDTFYSIEYTNSIWKSSWMENVSEAQWILELFLLMLVGCFFSANTDSWLVMAGSGPYSWLQPVTHPENHKQRSQG